MKDLYRILGIDPSDTQHEINLSYKAFARAHHPDLDHCKEKTDKFIEYSPYWQTLRNPTSRAEYDLTRPTYSTIDDLVRRVEATQADSKSQLHNFYKTRKDLSTRVKEFYDLIQEEDLRKEYRRIFSEIV